MDINHCLGKFGEAIPTQIYRKCNAWGGATLLQFVAIFELGYNSRQFNFKHGSNKNVQTSPKIYVYLYVVPPSQAEMLPTHIFGIPPSPNLPKRVHI